MYLWLKAVHIAAGATWAAGIVVAALAVAAASGAPSSPDHARGWLNVARGWDRRVTNPAMLVVFGLGITLGLQGGWFASPWLTVKLGLVVGLAALHGVLSGTLRRAARGEGGPARLARLPTAPAVIAAVAIIVILAVTKPL